MPTGINRLTKEPNMLGKKHSNRTKRLIGEKLRRGLSFKCEVCDKFFYRSPSEYKRGRMRFCSKQCSGKKMKGELKKLKPLNQSNWRINRKGYLETTRRRKRILQHRWIVETKILKRPLYGGEIIHHLNGVKTDNRIKNLAICANHTHHQYIKKLQERIKELER